MPSFDPDPDQVHAGARPKTHTSTGVSIPPPRPLPPMSPITNMTQSKVLSSILDGILNCHLLFMMLWIQVKLHKFLPKQGEIDRLFNQINKKVLRDTKLSMNLRDLKAAYLTSPHFRDIYLNLTHNKVPLGKEAAKRLEQNARSYMILDDLLFKIIEHDDGRLDTVLCIPTSKVHILLDTYHSSLIRGHSGITKCYQTFSQRFYCPNLAANLRAYITGCHTYQMFKKGKNFQRPCQKRININTPAMTRISMA